MASYRYLRDIKPEDLVPEKEAVLTGRAKAANWWHYHWKIVLAAGAAAALVLCFFYDVFWHRAPEPDYQLAVVGGMLTENQIEALEARLAACGEDANGDGQVLVQVNNYDVDYSAAGLAAENITLPGSESAGASSEALSASSAADAMAGTVDTYGQMAADVKLTADFQAAQSGIFIVYDPAGFERSTSALRYLDGTPSEADDDGYGPADWYNMVYRVSDCPALAAALQNGIGPKSEDEQDIGDVLLGNYYIGFRSTFNEKDAAALAADDTLYQKLTAGAVSTAEASGK